MSDAADFVREQDAEAETESERIFWRRPDISALSGQHGHIIVD
jgi:hypothetical protein